MAHIAAPLTLQPDDALQLESMLRQGTLEQRVAKRCRALLLGSEGLGNTGIAERLGMHRNAIANIRSRFKNTGLACLEDMPRSGRPPSRSAEVRRRIVTTVCGKPPKGMSRWSIQILAKRLGLSKSYVHSVLKGKHPSVRPWNYLEKARGRAKIAPMSRMRFTATEKAGLLTEFEDSGLSAAGFCRRENLRYQTFLNWRRKAAREHFPEAPAFIELPFAPEPPPPDPAGALTVELELCSGVVLRIRTQPAPAR